MSTNKSVIGVCQMLSTNDKSHNRAQISELVEKAKVKASFLFFPEGCDYIGTNVDETKGLSEPLTGDTVRFYKNLW
jgi:deaminated glutathione amidase